MLAAHLAVAQKWLGHNWQGLVIDGSKSNIDYVKNDPIYWRHQLTAVESFITTENINQILISNGLVGKIGLLSVDVDGNDYWIWEAIDAIQPRVCIFETQNVIPSDLSITIPYSPNFYCWDKSYGYSSFADFQ